MAKKKTQSVKKQSAASRSRTQDSQPDDAMSRVALLCQDQRWREAVQLIRSTSAKAKKDGKKNMAASLDMAVKKIEYSLRRQMAANLICETREFLRKEYLLDVGQ